MPEARGPVAFRRGNQRQVILPPQTSVSSFKKMSVTIVYFTGTVMINKCKELNTCLVHGKNSKTGSVLLF